MEYAVGKVYERTRKSVTPDGGSAAEVDLTVNDGYQITAVDATSWTWDDDGQLLEDDQGWDFTWTALGQLAAADHASQADRDHVYDAFGRRVETVRCNESLSGLTW